MALLCSLARALLDAAGSFVFSPEPAFESAIFPMRHEIFRTEKYNKYDVGE